MSQYQQDNVAEFYRDRHVFYTGATGLLGTAYLSRLILDTPVAKVYALVRGGEDRLWAIWKNYFPSSLIQQLQASQKLVVLDGDTTKPDFGLTEDGQRLIWNNASIFIHGASPIHLRMPLVEVARQVVEPSMALAKMALSCNQLIRFVFVSTAYTNTFLRRANDGGVYGYDANLKEDIIPIRTGVPSSAASEFCELMESGSTPEYQEVIHPYPYSYAKHLAERLIMEMFRDLGAEDKLLIFRPSCIGPAISKPFPFFEIPGSTPITTFVGTLIATPPADLLCASYLPNPSDATFDEIPVDVVVNRLIVHVSLRSDGCVHAVAGARDRQALDGLFAKAVKLCSSWRGQPNLVFTRDPSKQWRVAKLTGMMGTSFLFEDGKAELAWDRMNELERSSWPLWPSTDLSAPGYLQGRRRALTFLVAEMIHKEFRLPKSLAKFFLEGHDNLTSSL